MKRDILVNPAKRVGRPRVFNEGGTLNTAMLTFWRRGYESTSMPVLATEMGMSAPSIYSAFGDKKALFLKALDLYVGDLAAIKSHLDKASTAYEAARAMLQASVIRFTTPQNPRGCMLASATASCSAESADVQIESAKKRAGIENILKARIKTDLELKILPSETSAASLAALIIAVIQGLSVLARDGASRKKLLSVVEAVMVSWTISQV